MSDYLKVVEQKARELATWHGELWSELPAEERNKWYA